MCPRLETVGFGAMIQSTTGLEGKQDRRESGAAGTVSLYVEGDKLDNVWATVNAITHDRHLRLG